MQVATKGSYHIDIQENIIEVDAHGPFDSDIIEQYNNEIKSAIGNFNKLPWGSLVIYHGNVLFSSDTEQTLSEVIKYRIKHGMIANASVILDSHNTDLQQMQLHRVYQESKLPFHVFSNIDHAKDWLVDYVEQQRPKN